MDRLPLNALIGPAVVIAFGDDVMSVTAELLQPHSLDSEERVLIRTRNSKFVTQREFHPDYTYLAPDGAEYLASLGVKLVGVDYLSVEQFHSGHHRTHRTLLERGIVIVEEPGSAEFSGMPTAAIRTGCADLVLPLDQIGPAIQRLAWPVVLS